MAYLTVGKNGTSFDAQLESTAVQDDEGGVSQVRIAITNITKRKRAEEELKIAHDLLEKQKVGLEKANKELREAQEQLVPPREAVGPGCQLAGGLTHELRTPLGAIKNTVYFLFPSADPLTGDSTGRAYTSGVREVRRL